MKPGRICDRLYMLQTFSCVSEGAQLNEEVEQFSEKEIQHFMAGIRKITYEYKQANFFMIAAGVLLLLYIYLLICLYPFLIKPGYAETSTVKYRFLMAVSYGFSAGPMWIPSFIPLTFLCILIGTGLYIKRRDIRIRDFIRQLRFSTTDIMVACYAVFVTISAVVTPYRNDLIWGLELSYMGLASQYLFISIYFIASRLFDPDELKGVLYMSLLSSSLVFIIGILQRFGIDLFNLYAGITNKLFISTIGQNTYFSSYMIIFIMLGTFLVWISKPGSLMYITAAIQLFIASCLPCILNADMIFAGMFFALSFLFLLSFESIDRMKAFLEITLINLLAWCFIIIAWYLAKPEFRLEPLPKFIMRSPFIWIAVICLTLVYVFIRRKTEGKNVFDIGKYRCIGYIYAGLVCFSILAVAVYIILNTLQILPVNLRSNANYLLFDAFWGNGRGAIWHDTVMSFLMELRRSPFIAIFGAGPDRFFYVLRDHVHDWMLVYSDKVALFAHNEWLNAFICSGIFGGAAYLGIFISACIRFVRNRKMAPVALGAAVIAVAYLSHQMFGYQQYVSTPYIFLILGIGEQAVREEAKMV